VKEEVRKMEESQDSSKIPANLSISTFSVGLSCHSAGSKTSINTYCSRIPIHAAADSTEGKS